MNYFFNHHPILSFFSLIVLAGFTGRYLFAFTMYIDAKKRNDPNYVVTYEERLTELSNEIYTLNRPYGMKWNDAVSEAKFWLSISKKQYPHKE